jgi:hypothetical protein
MVNGMESGNTGRILIYEDGGRQLRVRIEGETVWLTQKQIADLYQVSKSTINEHILNIYASNELTQSATIRNFRIVQMEGDRSVTRTIDCFLEFNERNILTHAGSISHELAASHALEEFVKYNEHRKGSDLVDGRSDFDEFLASTRRLDRPADSTDRQGPDE